MADPLTIGIAAAPVIKSAFGAIQEEGARKRIKQLGARKGFEISPEMQRSYSDALREAEFGYSSAEKSAFQQRIAQNRDTILNRGQMVGGRGIAQALNAAVLSNQIGAELDFASSDAALRRSKRQYADQRGDVISNQRNRIDADRLSYREAVERALGGASSQGRTNIVEGLSEVPYAAASARYFSNPNENIDIQEDITIGDTSRRKSQMTLDPISSSRLPVSTSRDILRPAVFGQGSQYSFTRPRSILEY